ncbi:MAG: hypothetical protein H7177_09370 [Rhizobacter sp.]|nr:hypothetical protein [Bacteriovorax sp.]
MHTDQELIVIYRKRRKVGIVLFVFFILAFAVFKTVYPDINIFILSWMFCLSSAVLGGMNSVAAYYLEKKLPIPEPSNDEFDSLPKFLYVMSMTVIFGLGVFLPIIMKVYILPEIM